MDKEADALDRQEQTTAAEAVKPPDRKREEFLAMCRDFGHTEAQAEAEWQEWMMTQGG